MLGRHDALRSVISSTETFKQTNKQKKGEFKSKCKSLFTSYFVTKWLPNEEDVYRYFVWFEKKTKIKGVYVCMYKYRCGDTAEFLKKTKRRSRR